MTDAVQYELSDDVAVLRIDDGKVNALGPPVIGALNVDSIEQRKSRRRC